jgi:hypothetical protein
VWVSERRGQFAAVISAGLGAGRAMATTLNIAIGAVVVIGLFAVALAFLVW